MPRPQYLGTDIPVFSFKPNWAQSVRLQCLYRTIIKEALDTSEERRGGRPRCLYGISFQTLSLTGTEQGYLRRILELAQAMPIVMPVWTEQCRLTVNASGGSTSLTVDDTDETLFSVLVDYVLLWTSYNRWEVLEIQEVEANTITLAEATSGSFAAGSMVVPILIGKLPRQNLRQITDENGVFRVDFEERFNGLTDQSLVETTGVDPLDYEFSSECQDECVFSIPMAEGEEWILQIAAAEDGPWSNHIWFELDGTEETPGTKKLYVNNDYGGTHWFRVVNAEAEEAFGAVNVEASVIDAPVLSSISNATNIIGTRPVHGEGLFAYPYSQIENDLISPDRLYLVPRGRWEYTAAASGLSWDGSAPIPSITVPPGATYKWTRDGSDPTEDTEMRAFEGFAENLAAYRDDFKFILKIRCFKDGCQSPVTTILVDRALNLRDFFTSSGQAQASAGWCGLPIDGVEPGDSCALNYGGTDEFSDVLRIETFGSVEPATAGRRVYYCFNGPSTATYIGTPIYTDGWSMYEHQTSALVRHPTSWDPKQPCFMFANVQVTGGDIDYLQPDTFGATMTTPAGATAEFEGMLDTYIGAQIPNLPTESPIIELETLQFILTVHHDFYAHRADEYVPPATEEPEGPYVPAIPEAEYAWDDFEDYPDNDDVTETVLNEGAGWVDEWVIWQYGPSTNVITYDDFEAEEDGDAADQTLDGGDSWADDSEWLIVDYEEDRIAEDDMEDYSDGELGHVFLNAGSGWESYWTVIDYASRREAADSMEDYADGVVLTPSGLDEGTGWAGDWVVTAPTVLGPIISADAYAPTANVTMAVTGHAEAEIYYTMDGSEPSSSSTLYTTGFSISSDTTIRAVAYIDGYPTLYDSRRIYATSSPSRISGLKGWWKADAIVGLSDTNPITTWEDSSFSNADMVQSDSTYKPVYRTNIINGLPAVRFDSHQHFSYPGNPLHGFGSAEVFIVVKVDADPAASQATAGCWNFGGYGDSSFLLWWTDSNWYDNFATNIRKSTGNPSPSFTSFRLANMWSAPSEWGRLIDGANSFSTGTNDVWTQGQWRIGQSSDFYGVNYASLKGYIAEVILFDHKLSTADRDAVEAYIASKYALTIP